MPYDFRWKATIDREIKIDANDFGSHKRALQSSGLWLYRFKDRDRRDQFAARYGATIED